MPGVTRRGFLATSVGTAAGVAGIGALAAAAAPHMGGAAALPATTTATGEPLVAYVRSGSGGELSLMVGTREVSLHDADLVRRLHAAASGAQSQAVPASMFAR
jgi:hypothetical protein